VPPKKKKKLEKNKVKRPLTAWSYSNVEWYSLEDPKRKEDNELRDALKKSKGGKPGRKPKG
jgi:hypothetical protein